MEEAKEVFDLMLSKGSMVNARGYNILINGFSKHRRIDEARMLVPDVVTYDTLMDVFCKVGKLQDAEKLLSDAGLRQLPDVQTYAKTSNCRRQLNCLKR
ncbi:pentatricopeptide repeat-containing protein [Pyrus ussuriensis x Pyrus communis]|uniref:Pentatricopeptide repeat-containing protein n=1 Tax=Pyrus ussuriensis x Pyrus communis TaxID=2448454 RepID=A0A5N5FUN1_9ROSA|nr:pentatricopeptide repeat-containing protein [Pyrus ussuriensis x Pyrus communis]